MKEQTIRELLGDVTVRPVEVRSYSKKHLASLYFPEKSGDPRVATCHLMRWIRKNTGLLEALFDLGYCPYDKWFTSAQVQAIFRFLGTP